VTAARHAARRSVRASWWAPLVQWRNWRLLVKLAAVLLVPALLAVSLGIAQIHGYVTRADSYGDTQRRVEMRDELRTLLETLQMERTMSAERLSGGSLVDLSDLQQQTRRVDRAQAAVASTRNREVSFAGVAEHRYRDVVGLLDHLPALRAQVVSGSTASWTELNDYGTIIRGLLALDQALANSFSVPQLARPATALYDLEAVEEQIHLQHVILLQAADRGHTMTPTLTRALQESDVRLRDKLGEFRTVATSTELSDYQQTVTGPAVSRRAHVVSTALAVPLRSGTEKNATSLPLSANSWNHDSETTGMLVGKVAANLIHTLRTTSVKMQDRTSNQAGVVSVVIFAVLLLALAIGLAIGRHLLQSLTVLRSTAIDVAEHRLPAAVVSIREGRAADAVVDVVPLHTTEEFGQLATAFDTVHSQAIRLAAEQATLRGDLRNTLVNLSRRSQSLVDRLLLMMEQLERREEDPEQLAGLFTLDHLATRMRRNNENMMVLCGSTLVRSSHSAGLDTVLRGAVSEIEYYQRVLVQPSPPVDVIGYAAGDLGRLVAELLDNATVFSPPRTQVVIGSTREPDGSVEIVIQDDGIGMSENDLARANQRVAADTSMDTPASRQLGLFVVGRLASRHGITVNLSSQPGVRGLRVRVLVSAKLVATQAPSRPGRLGAIAERTTTAALPARASGGSSDGGTAASRPTQRPFTPAVTTRPAPADVDAPRKPDGSPWFTVAASATAPAAPSGGNTMDTPRPRAAAQEATPAPPSRPQAPGDPEPTGRPAPPLPFRRPAGHGAQEPDQSAALAQTGLPKRLTRTPSAPTRAERSATGDGAAASPDAGRAHSFLSSYQSGIRRARPDHAPKSIGDGQE
jgi:signal transduction histidine kinase